MPAEWKKPLFDSRGTQGYRDDLKDLRSRIAELKDRLERAYELEQSLVNIIADAEEAERGENAAHHSPDPA